MKKFAFLTFLFCLVAACSDVKMKGDPTSTSNTKAPCVCECKNIAITAAQSGELNLIVHISYETDPDCDIRIVVSHQAVYSDMRVAPWLFLEDVTVTGDGTTAVSGTPTQGEEIIGYNLQAYPVRVCDGLIIGWSTEFYVAK